MQNSNKPNKFQKINTKLVTKEEEGLHKSVASDMYADDPEDAEKVIADNLLSLDEIAELVESHKNRAVGIRGLRANSIIVDEFNSEDNYNTKETE